MTGTFFAVVGPSGAGKDTLIAGARARLIADRRFHFPARYVTRPAAAGGEDHVALTPDQFVAMRASGGFVLSWRANGLRYAVPADVEMHLAQGRNVVANLSREVIDPARRRFPSVRVIVVTAPPAILAARLAARGRETAAAIDRRLRRGGRADPIGDDVDVIVNDGDPAIAERRFVDLLKCRCRGPAAS